MPAVSEKQRRFFGADYARSKRGLRTKTGMSRDKLKEFASAIRPKHKMKAMKEFKP